MSPHRSPTRRQMRRRQPAPADSRRTARPPSRHPGTRTWATDLGDAHRHGARRPGPWRLGRQRLAARSREKGRSSDETSPPGPIKPAPDRLGLHSPVAQPGILPALQPQRIMLRVQQRIMLRVGNRTAVGWAVARGVRFCRTFLHVARVQKHTDMRESHAKRDQTHQHTHTVWVCLILL